MSLVSLETQLSSLLTPIDDKDIGGVFLTGCDIKQPLIKRKSPTLCLKCFLLAVEIALHVSQVSKLS